MFEPRLISGLDIEKNRIETILELPGVRKKDLRLKVNEDGFCVIYAYDDVKTHRCYPFGHPVIAEKAEASFEDGLLSFSVPVKEDAMGRDVKIH